MSSTFLTSTAADEAEQSAQAMRTLEQELDLLRGVGGLGVPALDYEVEVASMAQAPAAGHTPTSELHVPSYDSSQLEREPELPSGVDELDSAQLRLVEELESQRLRRDREARAGLQEELRRQEGAVREERDALLAYLDELRGRDDEAGSEIRGDGFGRRVEELAAEEQSRRGVAEAQQGFAQLAAITDDPKLREQLLEVQRLDDLLAREAEAAEAAEAGEPTDGVESGSGVGGKRSVEGGSSAAEGGGARAVTSSRLSPADLARLDRILDEGGEPADNPYEAAGARVHEVEARLQQLQQLYAPWDPLRGPPPSEPAAAEGGGEEPARGKLGGRKKDREPRRERKAPPGLLAPPADHLTELKEERADAQHLQQVKAQLAALAATPASQPPTEAEAAALVPLLAQLRTEALSRCSESAISIN